MCRATVGAVVLYLVSMGFVTAQSTKLEGTLYDAQTTSPLPFANVWLKGQKTGVHTDEKGHFEMKLFSDDTLVVSFLGYRTKELPVSVDHSQSLKIPLTSTVRALEEIEITATRGIVEEAFHDMAVSTFDIDRKSMFTLPSITGEPDFIKTLLLLPGATKGVEGSSDIFVRGGDADQNLVLFNGATVYNTGHLFGFLSVFNPYATENANLMTGGFPARLGGRLSSVVDITSRKPDFEQLTIEGGIGTITSNLALQAPLIKDKLSVLVAGRRTYADQVVKLFGESLPYYFYDLNAQVDYRINENIDLQYHFYSGDDDLDYRRRLNETSTTGTDFLIENATHTFSLDSRHSRRMTSVASLHYTRFHYNIHSFYQDNNLRVNSDISDIGFQHDFTYTLNAHHRIDKGLSVVRHKVVPNLIDSEGEIAELIPSERGRVREMLESGLYGSWRFSKSDIATELGLRISSAYQQNSLYINPEPRFSLRWQPTEAGVFKAAYSRMFQYMNRVSSSSFALPTDVWYPVTEQVKPQRADQFSLGYQHLLRQWDLLGSADVYYKDMKNQIAFREGTNLTLNNDFEEALLQGHGNSYGVELLLRKESGKFRGWLAYTLSWSNRQFAELNRGRPFRARYDRRHNLSLVTNYSATSRLTFSAVWEYISGARFTPLIGYYAVPNPALTGADLVPIYPDRNSVGLNDSHRLDLSMTLHGRYRPGKSWYGEWQLSIYNVYNRATPIAIDLIYDEAQDAYRYQQPGLFGVLPSITYRFTYKK